MNRRNFINLTGRSLAAGMLPISQFLVSNAMAQSEGIDTKRLMCLFTPNGAPLGEKTLWHPDAGTVNLKSANRTLEPVKQHCLFVDGLRVHRNGGDAHEQGEKAVLTAKGENSVDIQFAEHHKGQTPFNSLQFGPFSEFRGGSRNPSFKNGIQLTSIDRPLTLYTQLWGGTDLEPTYNGDLGVVSQIHADLSRIRNKIGSFEKQKLESHMDSLSQLESRLKLFSQSMKPSIQFGIVRDDHTLYDKETWYEVHRVFREIAVAALAMGLTRSINYMMGNGAFRRFAPLEDGTWAYDDHDMSHQGGEIHAEVKRAWMGEIAKLVQLMAAVPDGSGTLLDNTLVFHYSELGDLDHNGHYRMPFFLAGGKHWGLNSGTTLDFAHGTKNWVSHEGLLKSILRQAEVPFSTFGTGGDQPLEGIFS